MSASCVAPPRACERLAEMLPRFGGMFEFQTAAAPAGATPIPAGISAEMRRFFEDRTRRETTPVFVARLPGGRVFGPGAVLSPNGDLLARDVSTDFGKRFDEHWLLTYAKMRPPVYVPGSTAVVAVTLGDGYCHWLLEELPRLLLMRERTFDTVIAHAGASFIREALQLVPWRTRIQEARRYSHFECELLLIPSLIGGEGRPTPEAVQLVNAFASPLREQKPDFGERLYISREGATRRRVVNEAELWRLLEVRGFTKLRLEELSWKEQINAFSHAKVIVAPHGAGLANLLFCQAGARVVEIFHRDYVNPCFWHLAGVKGLDYRPVVAAVPGEPLRNDPRANRANIHVDTDAVLDALTRS